MAEMNSFSTGGAPGESGSTPNFSSDISPAPYTREGVTPPSREPNAAPNGRPPETSPGQEWAIDMPIDFSSMFGDTPWSDPNNIGAVQKAQPAQPQAQPQAPAPVDPNAAPSPIAGASSVDPAAAAAQPPQPRPFSKADVDMLPPGQSMSTHVGTISRDDSGQISITLSEEGQRIHDSLIAKEMSNFGYYLGHDDPKAPKPPIVPGKPFFNPFSGKWSDGWDPSSLTGF